MISLTHRIGPVLIISPHMDDEVLGCSSFLLDQSRERIVFYHHTTHATVPSEVLQGENKQLQERLLFIRRTATVSRLNQLDTVPVVDLIDEYQRIINDERPETLLIPFPSYNQDHRAVYEAALTAVRPHDQNFFVKKVLIYEEPETFGAYRKGPSFTPQYFRPIPIDQKLELVQIYKSQLRGHRSLEMIKAIAKIRGEQNHYDYAEGFEVVRWID